MIPLPENSKSVEMRRYKHAAPKGITPIDTKEQQELREQLRALRPGHGFNTGQITANETHIWVRHPQLDNIAVFDRKEQKILTSEPKKQKKFFKRNGPSDIVYT